MYAWLPDALEGPSTVVTANRRLARVLRDASALQQLAAGKSAWESPAIFSWHDWLGHRMEEASDQASLPTRITAHQSQLLWERCLSSEIGESLTGITNLVRLSRDAWQRIADARVPRAELTRSAENHDQRLFAAAAARYRGILERERWVDDAGLCALVEQLLNSGRIACRGRMTFAGFDRERPVVRSLMTSLTESGCDVRVAPTPEATVRAGLQSFENADAEMRAAGAWARQRLEKSPGETIGIIAGGLEQDADRKARLVREGLVPGWQYAPPSMGRAVNVSYGRKLTDYPAVAIGLLLLRWLVRDLSAGELGQLLRTPLLGAGQTGGRSRLDLKLRQLPDRSWSPALVSAAFRGGSGDDDAAEWFTTVAALTKDRRTLRKTASPAEWAVHIDQTLSACSWPGGGALSSEDFQLVNRWRDLLNDLARLELVSPAMSLMTAIQRLDRMAGETVFQPEAQGSFVQLMGPLEASGAEFDALWISGLTAESWPPPGNPSPVLSRRLQRDRGMPDADPSDTVAYARGLLLRMSASAPVVVCSYSLTEGDADQSPSGLLNELSSQAQAPESDPGWHAVRLLGVAATAPVADDAPAISPNEKISGGAGTIQRQLTNPLGAFISGRLGVRTLQPQAVGLPASLRGNIIHDALCNLYSDTPAQRDITAWSEDALNARIESAVESAFLRHERNAGAVLVELFKLERRRARVLLKQFVTLDRSRDDFAIAAVEQALPFAEADVRLELRADRIDRLPDGTYMILDYKTGAKKSLLDSSGMPKEIQLVAYSLAFAHPVSAVSLINIDTRDMSFSGAGSGFTDDTTWEQDLSGWKNLVKAACREISDGDVRINTTQSVKDARDFNLLTRYTELLRGV